MGTDIDWKRAVELADGFCINEDWQSVQLRHDRYVYAHPIEDIPQWFIDALAAQLVRQVDALDDAGLTVWGDQVCEIRDYSGEERIIAKGNAGTDRTENTVNAILDSGVLE